MANRRRVASERELRRQPPLLHLRPGRPAFRRSLRPDSGGRRPRTLDWVASKLQTSDREVRVVLGDPGIGLPRLASIASVPLTPGAEVPRAAADGNVRALSALPSPKRAEREATSELHLFPDIKNGDVFDLHFLSSSVRAGNHRRGLFVFSKTLRVVRETSVATA